MPIEGVPGAEDAHWEIDSEVSHAPEHPDSPPLSSGTPSASWGRSVLRFVGGFSHLLFFTLSLLLIIPSYASEVGRRYNTPTPNIAIVSCSLFVISLVIARLLKRETIAGLLFKSLVFALYASWVSTAMSDMAGPIMNRKWIQQLP